MTKLEAYSVFTPDEIRDVLSNDFGVDINPATIDAVVAFVMATYDDVMEWAERSGPGADYIINDELWSSAPERTISLGYSYDNAIDDLGDRIQATQPDFAGYAEIILGKFFTE